MNKREIKKAEKLLDPHTDRTDTMIYGDGQCITAYWIGGGQTIFYALDAVEKRCAEIEE